MPDRVVLIVGYDGAELIDIACVTSSLEIANRIGASPAYRAVLATAGGHGITCDSGLRLEAQAALERFNEPLDTLLVPGGHNHAQTAADPPLAGHVRRLATLARRVASGGVTSALDLTLAFIEEDHGMALARGVALGVVASLQRPGDQAQLSMFLPRQSTDDIVVRRASNHIVSHVDDDLSTTALARLAGVSERHLTRLFSTSLRQTPAQYVRRVRTEAAAQLLRTTRLPLAAVARRCGFRTTESLRQAFLAEYSVPPSRFRAQCQNAGFQHGIPRFRTGSGPAGGTAGAHARASTP